MTKLAMITPWPNQRTGIADYAYDLVVGLAAGGLEVDVYTDCPRARRTPLPANVSNVALQDMQNYPGNSEYQSVIYQMGNNSSFHLEMLSLLYDNPGIVQLHDPSLHHLIAFLLYRSNSSEYYRVLNYWYGYKKYKEVKNWISQGRGGFWDSERASEVPFFEPVLTNATACIVHSEYARNQVIQRMPELDVAVLPQVYRSMQPTPILEKANQEPKTLQIGVFGIVQKHKHVDLILEALRDTLKQSDKSYSDKSRFHLQIYGELDACSGNLPKLAKEYGLSSYVTFHGHQPESEFIRALKSVDVCISLRYPTLGETSAIVSRTMQLGIPTIVNRVGWYAELPDCVVKLQPGPNLLSDLKQQIMSVLESPSHFDSWRADCLRTSAGAFSFESVIEQYKKTIQTFSNPSEFIFPFGRTCKKSALA